MLQVGDTQKPMPLGRTNGWLGSRWLAASWTSGGSLRSGWLAAAALSLRPEEAAASLVMVSTRSRWSARAAPLVCVAGLVVLDEADKCLLCYTWVSSCSFSRCRTATAVSTSRYRHLNLSLSSLPSGGVGGGDDGSSGCVGCAGITCTLGFDSGCGS